MNVKIRRYITAILSAILIALIILLVIDTKELKSLSDSRGREPEGNNNAIKIGLSMGTLKEDRWLRDRDIFVARAKALGADVIVQNANNNDEDQAEQVRYLLSRGIDVLVIVPNNRVKSADAVEAAKKAGVKVIAYDRLVLKSNVDLYISFDSQEVGRLMAQALVDKVPYGNYLIINGGISDNNSSLIKKGYDGVLEPFVRAGKINIIAEEWAEDWMSEYAFNTTEKWLKKGTKIDAILAANDMLAAGAIRALSEYKLSGDVIVTGQDAEATACQRIVDGTQFMTVYKPVDRLAEAASDMAVKMAKGESISVPGTIYDGKYDVPCYMLKPIAVDIDNLDDTVIKDGFHNYDEIYGR
ncbi:sugar ABC transporter substrate-binding protein [Mahella australiensis]|uniref:Xylose-binding protein n=1 Tax=Mahella australiensis (strain DSM 15567 / CIP 107919 / 50-1 BON) TaxID=697281 RepID=F3ZWC5_MAHA5|nr:substrate-binding domain-containing protein [Mahella australiensis]AEE97534.1 xylose-binding protein [Mahella australiensis 50-1 BON]